MCRTSGYGAPYLFKTHLRKTRHRQGKGAKKNFASLREISHFPLLCVPYLLIHIAVGSDC